MSAAITVRPAETADADVITDFNCRLADESESKRLDPSTTLAGVLEVLANPMHGRYYVAEHDGRPVGQLLVTYEWSDWRNGRFWWIQSVYVMPAHRRRGVFRALYGHLDDLAAKSPDVCGLRLYVEAGNAPARSTYAAIGMDETGYLVMEKAFR
jgi:GNAT superfamily N-acetyltransferase